MCDTAMDSNDSLTAEEHLPFCKEFREAVNIYIIGALAVIGIAGNAISIAVLNRDIQNRIAIFYLQCLSAADGFVLIVSFVVLTMYYGILYSTNDFVESTMIKYIGAYVNPVGSMAQAAAVWMVVVLSCNRYQVICNPYATKHFTLTRAKVQVIIVVLASILVNIPRFLQMKVYHVTAENGTSQTCFKSTAVGDHFLYRMVYLNILYTIFVLILPLVLLVVINTKIIRELQSSKQRMRKNSLLYQGTSEDNITVVMVIIIIILLVCHTPDRVVQVARFFVVNKDTISCPEPIYFAANICNVLIIFNSSVNFFVYYIFRPRFRQLMCQRATLVENKNSSRSLNSL